MWQRKPGFETLVHIILEQQVSLASARAALDKLKVKLGKVTPQKLLALTDAELRACYFSRQKTNYARALAEAIVNGNLRISQLKMAADEEVRATLKKIKGIGDWTVDIFLLMALQRCDIFPTGDLAMINSLKKIKALPATTTREEMIALAAAWEPYRSLATMILWHSYLMERSRPAVSVPRRKPRR
jgi:DNA-3-methyladenine glycosylase II